VSVAATGAGSGIVETAGIAAAAVGAAAAGGVASTVATVSSLKSRSSPSAVNKRLSLTLNSLSSFLLCAISFPDFLSL
jgi:hypothetical protein